MKKKYDLVGFGEAMVRFTPLNHARLEQSSSLHLSISAAELNVAVNTSRLGLKTAWVSKLVDTWSGHYIINKGREHGVDMSGVKLIPFDVANLILFLVSDEASYITGATIDSNGGRWMV